MNPTVIDDMGWAMAEVYGSVTDRILANIAKYFPYIEQGKEPKRLFDYQVKKLAEMGQLTSETVDIIANSLGGADAMLRQELETAIRVALKDVDPVLRKAAEQGLLNGPGFVPPELSPSQMTAFTTYYRQSADKLNFVNTVMLESTQAAYTQTVSDIVNRVQRTQGILNAAAGELVTGVSAWNTAMHDAVQRMVNNGLTGFIDHAGHRWSPEAYVAMDIRTTLHNTANAAVWERQEEYGSDIYQVSTHNGARPLCYPWQGKLISRNDVVQEVPDFDGVIQHVYAQSETTYGQAAGLFGCNCQHYPIPFVPSFSRMRGEPQSEEENAKTYEESQKQRELERKLRKEKLDLEVMKAQGAPADEIKAQRARVKKASDDIQTFCDETGRTRRRNREYTPVNATFPPKDSYDPATFPTDERDRINDWFRNGGDNPPQNPSGASIGPDDVPPQGITHAAFTPARTIQEAEEQAKQFLAYSGSVSYRGIDIEYANACNRVLGDVQANYDVSRIGSIQPMNMRSKLFKGSTAEAAYRWGGVGGDLFINPTYYRSKATFATHKTEIDQLMQTVLSGGDKLLSTASGAKREYIQALINTRRQCVSQSYDFAEGTFVHECGHRLDDNLFRKMLVDAFGGSNVTFADRMAESRRQYGSNISGYAVTTNQEYIAESFTAWWYGEADKIDPTIRAVFEGAMKK